MCAPLKSEQGVIMHHWTKRLFALAALLLLTGCLWGPGRFNSELTLKKDGSFVLDYRGEIMLQMPDDKSGPKPWADSMATCYADGRTETNIEALPVAIEASQEVGADVERHVAAFAHVARLAPGLHAAHRRPARLVLRVLWILANRVLTVTSTPSL